MDYYVVYRDRSSLHFWDVFTSKGFRHCSAIWWDGFNWISMDHIACNIEVGIMPYGKKDDVVQILKDEGFIVQKVKQSDNERFIFRGWMTCVTVVKHLLGIRAAWVVTPKQLFNYLERRKQ